MQVVQLSDALMIYLRNQIILVKFIFIAIFLVKLDTPKPLKLIKGRLEEVSFLNESESVNIVEKLS